MTKEFFQDDCEGCRPALLEIDQKTGKAVPLPKDNPVQAEAERVWDEETSFEERAACHSVWCTNSKDPQDLQLCGQVAEKMKTALEKLKDEETD